MSIKTFAEAKDYILIALMGYVSVIATAGAIWAIKNNTQDAIQAHQINETKAIVDKNTADIAVLKDQRVNDRIDNEDRFVKIEAILPDNDYRPKRSQTAER